MAVTKIIAVLPGDGIGPEVMAEAKKVLGAVVAKFGHTFTYRDGLIGGAAWDACGSHFPEETKKLCEGVDAILFGSVGGPVEEQMTEKWKNCETESVLGLRKHFRFNINLRPSKVYPALQNKCVLRPDIVAKGIDILTVRELSSGIYFGEHRTEVVDGQKVAHDDMTYDEKTIEAVAHAAFKAALQRRKKLTSVDKANVLDCSKLWREVVDRVAKDYPEVTYEHALIDSCVMQVLKRPHEYDVFLTGNMFGDILSDETSVFAGSLGMLPSASLNAEGFGMYEPSGGSAPRHAGKGIINPIAQILSAAMMLKYSFGLDAEYDAIVAAVEKALSDGVRTYDIADEGQAPASTSEMGDAIVKNLT